MSTILSHEELISRAKNGNKTAASELYERYVDRIYRYIAYLVPLKAAEDLTAEVFVQMVEQILSFEDTATAFEARLYQIASACVSQFHRLLAPKRQDAVDENISSHPSQPKGNSLDVRKMTPLEEVLVKLELEDQALLILRFVERKSQKEVAEIMHKNEDRIQLAQYHALKRLAQFRKS